MILALIIYLTSFVGIALIHTNLFSVDVILYANIFYAFLALVPTIPVLFKAFGSGRDTIYLSIIFLLGGCAYAIYVPTVIDRSLSLYLVQKIYEKDGITKSEMQKLIVDEYLEDHRVVEVRLAEQLKSGTIRYNPITECVTITPFGELLTIAVGAYREYFLPKKRLIGDQYSDAIYYENIVKKSSKSNSRGSSCE